MNDIDLAKIALLSAAIRNGRGLILAGLTSPANENDPPAVAIKQMALDRWIRLTDMTFLKHDKENPDQLTRVFQVEEKGFHHLQELEKRQQSEGAPPQETLQ